MKQKLIASYYICLVMIVAFQVLITVFQGSLLVHQSYRIAQLSDQGESLKQQKEQLSLKIYSNQSLSMVQNSEAISSFEPVAKPLVISAPASRVAASTL